jgi:hypothetical protein
MDAVLLQVEADTLVGAELSWEMLTRAAYSCAEPFCSPLI